MNDNLKQIVEKPVVFKNIVSKKPKLQRAQTVPQSEPVTDRSIYERINESINLIKLKLRESEKFSR